MRALQFGAYVDQLPDVIQHALDQRDLIQVTAPHRVGQVPAHPRGSGPDQNSRAGRATTPRNRPRNSLSSPGTATSRTQPGRDTEPTASTTWSWCTTCLCRYGAYVNHAGSVGVRGSSPLSSTPKPQVKARPPTLDGRALIV